MAKKCATAVSRKLQRMKAAKKRMSNTVAPWNRREGV